MSSLDYDTIKNNLSERYNAQLDANVSFFTGIALSVADALIEIEGEIVAIKIVGEGTTVEDIEQFFYECEQEGEFPLFLFEKPNKSKVAVVCSYMNTSAFAIDKELNITPFIINKNGVQVSNETFLLEDFEIRYKYYFNVGRTVFGFQFTKEPFKILYLRKEIEYVPYVQKSSESRSCSSKQKPIYDEEELQNLYLSMEYDELFQKLQPVIEYGLNRALESEYCDEDMIQDINLTIWEKILKDEIKKPESIGAFTISVCKFYVLNKNRKEANRRRIMNKKWVSQN